MNIENSPKKKDGFSHSFKSKYKFQKISKKKNSKNFSEDDLVNVDDNYNKNKNNFLEKLQENEDVGFIKTLIKLKQKSNSNLLQQNRENENFEKKINNNLYSKKTLALSPIKLNINEINKKHIKSKSRNFKKKNQYNNLIFNFSNNDNNNKNNFNSINNNHNDKKLLINLNTPNNTKPIKIKEQKSHSQTKYHFNKTLNNYKKKNIDNTIKKEINKNLNKTHHHFNRRSHSQINKNKKQIDNKIPRAVINLYDVIENKRYAFTPKNKVKNE